MIVLPYFNLVTGVLPATIASFIIGAIWFSPPALGNQFRTWVGMTEAQWKGNQRKSIVFGFIFNYITALFLAYFIKYAVPVGATYIDGLEVGFLAWLGFPAMVYLTTWVFELRPKKLSVNALAHSLVIYLVMGAILAVWA